MAEHPVDYVLPLRPHAVPLASQIEAVEMAIDMRNHLIETAAHPTPWSLAQLNALRGALLTLQRVARPPLDYRTRKIS